MSEQGTPSVDAGAAHASDEVVVLLVDDQMIIGEAVRRILAGAGAGTGAGAGAGAGQSAIRFHFCQKAEEAIATAARIGPTVILQDLVMPGADGLDLVKQYRAQEATKQTPIVVLSSKEEGVTKAQAFANGANDYIVKLPDAAELLARIRYHSGGYRAQLRARAFAESERRRQIAERKAESVNARNTLIFALAKLAESRDTDTGLHLERIAAYSRVLAEQLRATMPELTDEWNMNLQLASSLHDIGKVGIPDAVLLKPGKLTPEERLEIEKHPGIGADALNAILARQPGDELLRMARNIAACHHERWDGNGYPRKLKGEEIPLEARIVSVADVYDALTSKRVYKPAMPHAEAVKMIVAGRGTQFDPLVVDALEKCDAVFQLAGSQFHEGEERAGEAKEKP
ncbi:MAG: HD domain-containing protein [Phycisphaerae bacterium]|nr:HD domain-containing protein [Phycisphaerae bacterium]